MARDEMLYLRHILDAINIVEEYLHGVSESQFNNTRLLQDGVTLCVYNSETLSRNNLVSRAQEKRHDNR